MQMNLSHFDESEQMEISYYQDHPEWKLISHNAVRNSAKYDCCPEEYLDIMYTLKLKRATTYVTHMFMAPSIICALLIPTLLTKDSGRL